MSRNLLNQKGNVIYVNSVQSGNAVDVETTGGTSQSSVNISMKNDTTEQTSPNNDDWLLIADNATGKIIKRIQYSNFVDGSSNWILNSNNVLSPILPTTKVAIGGNTIANGFEMQNNGDFNNTGNITTQSLTVSGISGDPNRIAIKDLNLSNTIHVHTPSINNDVNLTLPSIGGTLALEYTGSSPISVNNTTHTISLGGTVPVSNGGTGQTTYSDGELLIGNSSGGLSKSTLSVGNGLLLINGDGSITLTTPWSIDTTNYFIYPTDVNYGLLIGKTTPTNALNSFEVFGFSLLGFVKAEEITITNGFSLKFLEASFNGTHSVSLVPPASIPSDYSINLPTSTGTLALKSDTGTVNGSLTQTGTLSSGSLSLMGGILFNDNFGGTNGFKSLKLNQTGNSTYGFVNYTDFGSDIATYVNDSIVKYSSIGSVTGDCIFGLYAGNIEFLVCQPSNRNYVMIGTKAPSVDGYSIPVALTVVNNTSNLDYDDAKIRIESLQNGYDPILELVSNSGTDNSTKYKASISCDQYGQLNFETNSSISPYIQANSKFINYKSVYFTNLDSNASSTAVEFHSQNSIFSTSTKSWRNQIGSTGDLHFDYRTSVNNNWVGQAFVSPTTGTYTPMNFTGQHRCIPEVEDLYDNVENYIGMVVETTGQFNSIDYENTEEDIILEDTIKEYTDVNTHVKHKEKNIKTPAKRLNQVVFSNTEPSIDEAQPIIRLTTTSKSKKVYGVISQREVSQNGKRVFSVGTFSSIVSDLTDNRLVINSIGEGGVLVCNQNGDIENGDLLCSSDITGIAMKQDTDFIMNYTIGKATQDYNFNGNENKLIGCVYYCG